MGADVITEASIAVWQTLTDDQLRRLSPPQFHELVSDRGLTDEESDEAWQDFRERRDRVFG